MNNSSRITIILSLLTVVMVMTGSAYGVKTGMVFAFSMAAAMNFFCFLYFDKIMLAMLGPMKPVPVSYVNSRLRPMRSAGFTKSDT